MISNGAATFSRADYSFGPSTPASRYAWYTDVFLPGITSLFENHSAYRVVRSVHQEGAGIPMPGDLGNLKLFGGLSMADRFAFLFLEGTGDAKSDAIVIGLGCNTSSFVLNIGIGRRTNGTWEPLTAAGQGNDPLILTEIALQAPYTILLSNHTGFLAGGALVPLPEHSHAMRVTVNPSHVARSLTLGSGTQCSLPIGVASVLISTLLAEDTFTAEADGYAPVTTDLLPTTDQVIELLKLDGTRRIAVTTSPDATVRYYTGEFLNRESLDPEVLLGNGNTSFDLDVATACYVTATRGDITKGTWLDASEEDQAVNLTFTGSVEGPIAPGPEPVDAPAVPDGMMVLRCKVAVPGTLRYNNDGIFDEVDPIEVTEPGFVDYAIPAPQIGCSGGMLEFAPVSGGGSYFRAIVFQADTYISVPIGPMLVTVTSTADGQIFWDADGPFQWLPGDGDPVSNLIAGVPAQFAVDSSGYVNVAIAGTDHVVRVHCDFAPGGTKEITLNEGSIADGIATLLPAWLSDNPWAIAVIGVIIVGIVLLLGGVRR